MLRRLELSGFKCFDQAGIDLPLAPITVLLGANSIGISSVFQALVAMQQSWENYSDICCFSPRGPSIDLNS